MGEEYSPPDQAEPRQDYSRRRLLWLGVALASGTSLTVLTACGGEGDDDDDEEEDDD